MGTPGKCIASLGVANLTLLWGQNLPGRVSVTCDAWSSRELFSFFAVSAHIAVEDQKHEEEFGKVKLEGHNYLLVFRELEVLEHDNSCVVRLPVSRYTRTLVILFRFALPMFHAVLTIFDALYAPSPPFATETFIAIPGRRSPCPYLTRPLTYIAPSCTVALSLALFLERVLRVSWTLLYPSHTVTYLDT